MPGREFLSLPGCGIEGNLKVECGVRKARIKVGYQYYWRDAGIIDSKSAEWRKNRWWEAGFTSNILDPCFLMRDRCKTKAKVIASDQSPRTLIA